MNEVRIRSERGQSMVEFAFVLPVLAIFLFAIMQFGITFHQYLTLTDAVREGARTAAVSRRASDPVKITKEKIRASAVNLDQSKLEISVSSPTWKPGDDVTVTATYPYAIDVLGVVVKSGRLTSTTRERVE